MNNTKAPLPLLPFLVPFSPLSPCPSSLPPPLSPSSPRTATPLLHHCYTAKPFPPRTC